MTGKIAPFFVMVSTLFLSSVLLSGMGTGLIAADPLTTPALTAQTRSYLPAVWGVMQGPAATPETPLPTLTSSPSCTPSTLYTATATATATGSPTATTTLTATATTTVTGTPTNTSTPEKPTATKTNTPQPSHTPTVTSSPEPPLNPPQGVAASDGIYPDRVQVIWYAVAGAAYYEVYRSTAAEDTGTILGSTTGPSFNDTNASQGVLYYYRVRACNLTACSNFSAPDSGFLAAAA